MGLDAGREMSHQRAALTAVVDDVVIVGMEIAAAVAFARGLLLVAVLVAILGAAVEKKGEGETLRKTPD
jgi:hypothetical protein